MDETEVIEQDRNLTPIFVTVGTGLVLVGAGIALAYFLKKRKRTYVRVVPPVVVDEDWHLGDLEVVPDEEDPAGIFIEEKLADPVEVHRIFSDTQDEWDYQEEVSRRTDAAPYILHKDEFYANERDYTQSTLTYYAGDDILVDEQDAPIYNYKNILGELRFGHGSEDQNTVYIRSIQLKAEYEVIRDEGKYSVEVLGLEIEENARETELKHSGDRKFRES